MGKKHTYINIVFGKREGKQEGRVTTNVGYTYCEHCAVSFFGKHKGEGNALRVDKKRKSTSEFG